MPHMQLQSTAIKPDSTQPLETMPANTIIPHFHRFLHIRKHHCAYALYVILSNTNPPNANKYTSHTQHIKLQTWWVICRFRMRFRYSYFTDHYVTVGLVFPLSTDGKHILHHTLIYVSYSVFRIELKPMFVELIKFSCTQQYKV